MPLGGRARNGPDKGFWHYQEQKKAVRIAAFRERITACRPGTVCGQRFQKEGTNRMTTVNISSRPASIRKESVHFPGVAMAE